MNSSISSSKSFALSFFTVFLLSACSFVVASEFLVRIYVAPYHPLEKKIQAFHKGTISTAAFGDSQVVSGIVPSNRLDNYSDTGENILTTLSKVEAYITKKHGRRVIIQLAPHNFAFYRLKTDQSARLNDFLSPPRSFQLQILRPHYRRYLFQYWTAIFREPKRLLNPKPKEIVSEDARFTDLPELEQKQKASIRVQLHTPVQGSEKTDEMARLKRTLINLSQKGIHVCLVSMPVSSYYRKAAQHNDDFMKLRSHFRNLSMELNIKYEDLWDQLDDHYFENSDHLGPEGARLLTAIVTKRCG